MILKGVKMETVKFYEETIYVWTCPKCGHYHEPQDPPDNEETVFCENMECDGEFKPEQG
jgi:rubrerythrin